MLYPLPAVMGELSEAGGKAEYHHCGVDRYDLQLSCNGIDLSSAGAIFLPYNKRNG